TCRSRAWQSLTLQQSRRKNPFRLHRKPPDHDGPVPYPKLHQLDGRYHIGAHMEKDINIIVDVEPDEAELLLSLVENLFDDWYIARQKRQERLAQVTASVEQKDAIRKVPSE
ncbi:MAG: hypothetical protein O9352_21390, partial [Rhizobium sp.]|nr:hypothetical protein [Rhizobium sp.]